MCVLGKAAELDKFLLQVINNALDFVGTQKECEEYLIKLEERLSSDRFDKLKGQVYDVGTVLEEAQEEAESHEQPACFPREKYDKVKGGWQFVLSKV